MTEERKHRLIWGVLLLIGALGSESLRNNPALGITPLAVGFISGAACACMLAAVRMSDWRMGALIAAATPVFLWSQRFMDGFMIPVEILVNLTMVAVMYGILRRKQQCYLISVLLLTVAGFVVLLIGGSVALWLVKHESITRAFVASFHTYMFDGFSLLGAAIVCVPTGKKTASAASKE